MPSRRELRLQASPACRGASVKTSTFARGSVVPDAPRAAATKALNFASRVGQREARRRRERLRRSRSAWTNAAGDDSRRRSRPASGAPRERSPARSAPSAASRAFSSSGGELAPGGGAAAARRSRPPPRAGCAPAGRRGCTSRRGGRAARRASSSACSARVVREARAASAFTALPRRPCPRAARAPPRQLLLPREPLPRSPSASGAVAGSMSVSSPWYSAGSSCIGVAVSSSRPQQFSRERLGGGEGLLALEVVRLVDDDQVPEGVRGGRLARGAPRCAASSSRLVTTRSKRAHGETSGCSSSDCA